KFVALVLVLGLLLLGLSALGQLTRSQLRDDERFTVAFADIDCPFPPQKTRTEFLREVQSLGNFADTLQILDDNLPKQLAKAFARHPAVARVDGVKITAARQVQVQLTFRPPEAYATIT